MPFRSRKDELCTREHLRQRFASRTLSKEEGRTKRSGVVASAMKNDEYMCVVSRWRNNKRIGIAVFRSGMFTGSLEVLEVLKVAFFKS